jgi:hypothetical protein
MFLFACDSESSDDKVDLNMKLLIDVWDEDFFPKVGKDFIGYCEPTIAELLECAVNRTPLSLKPPPLPHNQNPGKLFVDVALLGFPKVSNQILLFLQHCINHFHISRSCPYRGTRHRSPCSLRATHPSRTKRILICRFTIKPFS